MQSEATPLTDKALEQLKESYDVPIKQFFALDDERYMRMMELTKNKTNVGIEAIREHVINRPPEEKDALMAAIALISSADVLANNRMPKNIEDYGDQVKEIIEDYLDNPDTPFTVSRDLKQIGLAASIANRKDSLGMSNSLNDSANNSGSEEINPDTIQIQIRLLNFRKRRQEANLKKLCTDEQPHLEAEAKKVLKENFTVMTNAINGIKTRTKTQQQPSPEMAAPAP